MRVDQAFLDFLKNYFVSRKYDSTVQGILSPVENESTDLGKPYQRFARIYARTIIADNFTSTGSGANADTVDGYHAVSSPAADSLLALDGSAEFPTSVYPDALLADGSRALSGNLDVNPLVTIDGVDISVFYSAYSTHGHSLSSLTDPTATKSFDMGGLSLQFLFDSPDNGEAYVGAFEIIGTGAFAGDLLRVQQHTGNPGVANLVRLQAEDADVLPLVVIGTGTYVATFSGGQISIDPGSATPPFVLSADAQGQTVTGLKADQLSKSVSTGNGLSGGGDLTADRTLSVDQTYNFTWTGSHTFQSTITSRNIIPELTDTYDLGSSLRLWRQGFLSQINAVIFAQETITLLGGWLIVGKNEGSLAAAVADSDTTVDFGQSMTEGHFILIRAHDTGGSVKAEYMQVGTLVSGTVYNVTRDLADAHGTDPAWAEGTPYIVLGTTGDGRIELNAYDTPRIQIVEQGATYNAQTERIRIGDLNGWGPVVTQQFGWAVGDYSGNEFAYYTPTDGLIIRGTIRADDGYLGALSIDGVLSIGSSGGVYQGTGSFASPTTGLKIWNDSGVGRIGGFSSGSAQWYADTDGKLYAAAGDVVIDAAGILCASSTDYLGGGAVITFGDSATSGLRGSIYGYVPSPYYDEYAVGIMAVNDKTGTDLRETTLIIGAHEDSGLQAYFHLSSVSGISASTLMLIDTSKELYVYGTIRAGSLSSTSGALSLYKSSASPSSVASDYVTLFVSPVELPTWENDAGTVYGAHMDYICLSPGGESRMVNTSYNTFGSYTNTIAFVDAATGTAAWNIAVPRGWGAHGSKKLYAAVFWAPSGTGTGNVVWSLDVMRFRNGETYGDTVTISPLSTTTSAAPGVNARVVRATGSVVISDLAEGDGAVVVLTRLGSHASDTFANTARVLAVHLWVAD